MRIDDVEVTVSVELEVDTDENGMVTHKALATPLGQPPAPAWLAAAILDCIDPDSLQESVLDQLAWNEQADLEDHYERMHD